MANVRINFPSDLNVNGNGGFFIWGHYDPTYFTGMQVGGTYSMVDDTTGAPVGAGGLTMGHPLPCNWYAMIENATCQNSVALTVTVQDNAGHKDSDSSTFTIGGLVAIPMKDGKANKQ